MNAHAPITADPGAVYGAIGQAIAELAKDGIQKKGRNQQQGYNFRGVDDVMTALAPILVKTKLAILPRFTERSVEMRETKSGGALFYSTVRGEFDIVSTEDGSRHTIATFGEAMDSGDKSTNKAMSAAFKYACFQAFCIPLEGMGEDADATTHDVAPPRSTVPDDFDPAATALRIEGLLRTASSPAEIAQIWNTDSREERAKLKKADPALYSSLSKTLEFEQQRVAPAKGPDVPAAELTH